MMGLLGKNLKKLSGKSRPPSPISNKNIDDDSMYETNDEEDE